MTEKEKITRATGVVGAATMLSRIFGLVRDVVIARLLGAGFGADAFFMAFTIPNVLRRFFAEGSLTAAFVPTFSEIHHKEGPEESRQVAHICWTLLLLVMIAVTTLGILASPVLVRGIGWGFSSIEGKLELTTFLNRLMFPYIFFASLLALVTGILNVLGRYFWPAASPVLLNLAMIASALLLADRFALPVTALAVGVLIGGALQLAIQFPVLRRAGFSMRLNFNFRHPAVRRMARLMLPGLAGVAIYQINIIITRLLASFLPEGGLTYLYYGQRLFELPQGIFVVSLAQALLPALSRQAVDHDEEGFKGSLRYAMTLIGMISIPASVGLIVCAVPVYSLFFMRGAFEYQDVLQSAQVLAVYAPGLLFVGISRIVVPTFYALKDTRTPVLISFGTLIVNVAAGLLLMGPLQHVGLALGLTLSALFNSAALLWMLRKKTGPLGLAPLLGRMARILPGTILMAWFVNIVLANGPWQEPGLLWLKVGMLTLAITGGALVFVVTCMILRVEEVFKLIGIVRSKVSICKK